MVIFNFLSVFESKKVEKKSPEELIEKKRHNRKK